MRSIHNNHLIAGTRGQEKVSVRVIIITVRVLIIAVRLYNNMQKN